MAFSLLGMKNSRPRTSLCRTSLCLALLLGLTALGSSAADEVILKNGRSIYGEVIRKTSKEVVVRLESGEKLKLPRGMVKEIVASAPTPDPKPSVAPSPESSQGSQEGESPAASDTKSVRLRWRLAKGQKLRYQHEVEVRVLDGKGEYAREHSTWFELVGVAERPEGFMVELTITRILSRTLRDNLEVERHDSRDPDPKLRPDGGNLIGVPISFQVRGEGDVRLIAYGRGAIPEDQAAALEQSLTTGIYRYMVQGLLGVFPSEPLSLEHPGWRTSLSLNSANKLSFALAHRVSKIEAERVYIRQEGSAQLDGAGEGEGKIKFGLGSAKGLAKFSRAGVLEESRVRSTFRATQLDPSGGKSATLRLTVLTIRLD